MRFGKVLGCLGEVLRRLGDVSEQLGELLGRFVKTVVSFLKFARHLEYKTKIEIRWFL